MRLIQKIRNYTFEDTGVEQLILKLVLRTAALRLH